MIFEYSFNITILSKVKMKKIPKSNFIRKISRLGRLLHVCIHIDYL